ncbi:MAG: type VI secretion system-associated protein TagF [Acidiferrobacterales bacterium]
MSVMSLFSKKTKQPAELTTEMLTGFFGKLPARPDFVRHQTSHPAIKMLDQWIHEGIAYLVRRFPGDWKERVSGFPAINFYVAGDGNGAVISGVIQPSHDNTGRHHPIVNFSMLKNMNPVAILPLVPFHFEDFYSAASILGNGASESLALDAFTQKNISLASELPDLKVSNCAQRRSGVFTETTMSKFWADVVPDFDQTRRLTFIRDIIQTLRLAANRGPLRTAWGIRFPLGTKNQRNMEVSFWLSLVTSYVADDKWRPHVFWTEEGEGLMAALTLYFRAPGASSFAQLVCPECDEGGVVDLVRRPLENMPEITEQNLTDLANGEFLNLEQGLQAWGRS